MDNKLIGTENNIVFYEDENNNTKVEVRLQDEDVWLNVNAIANLFNVGRPAIQKLVGANSIKKADEMIFITTSDFSNEAKDYANKVGVKLINGKELIKMIATVNNSEENLIVAESEWSLNFDDLKKYIPKDINVSIEYKKSNITLMNTME